MTKQLRHTRVAELMDTAQPNIVKDIADWIEIELEDFFATKLTNAYTAVYDEYKVKTQGDARKVNPSIDRWEKQKIKEALSELMLRTKGE